MVDEENDYSSDEINEIINQANNLQAENIKLNSALSGMGNQTKDGNFLHIQLSTEYMLEKLEHFYRGDTQGINENGEIDWIKPKNKELITFNEFGVSSLMEVVTKYIDKNTILSNYTEDRINQIIGDIGNELILFILCNYEKMGMDTYFKKTKFRLVVTTTAHIIESSYRRAKGGKTLEELNQSKVVGQFDRQQPIMKVPSKKGGFFNKIFN